jgi:hypothetical protein
MRYTAHEIKNAMWGVLGLVLEIGLPSTKRNSEKELTITSRFKKIGTATEKSNLYFGLLFFAIRPKFGRRNKNN